ncbi:hypothetical protein ACGFMM_30835 [Streptomyces sp. NPDC048604]|uniref:hypothetical protein n=1 Tax=Streptomyces sp. NPDC048604 TaxID=3365578 RepID=UPI003720DD1B
MTTQTWDDLPPAVRARLDGLVRPTGSAVPVIGGFTPGVRVRMPTRNGAVFVKAIPSDSGAADMYRVEASANEVLPTGIGPRLLASFEADGWVTLAFDFIVGRHPDLAPGSADLQLVSETLSRLHEPLTPCPLPDAPHITTSAILQGAAAEQFAGDTLLHCDLRADNLLIAEDGKTRVIDWAWPHRGPAWIDTAFLVPQLILAGHTAPDAEKWAARIPAYQQADPAAVTAFATSLTAYWTSRADQGSPRLQTYRARAAAAGRAWITERSTL